MLFNDPFSIFLKENACRPGEWKQEKSATVLEDLQNDFVTRGWGGRNMVDSTTELDSFFPRSTLQDSALLAHGRLTVHSEVFCAPLGTPAAEALWQYVCLSSGGELETPAWPLHRVGI